MDRLRVEALPQITPIAEAERAIHGAHRDAGEAA
jgi:hypothetical protein